MRQGTVLLGGASPDGVDRIQQCCTCGVKMESNGWCSRWQPRLQVAGAVVEPPGWSLWR